jgi:hypothetical protein
LVAFRSVGTGDRTSGTPGSELLVSVLVGLCLGGCLAMVPRLQSGEFQTGTLLAIGVVFSVGGRAALGVLSLHDVPLVATRQRVRRKDLAFGAGAGAATGLLYGFVQQTPRGVAVGVVAWVGFTVGVAWTRPPDRPEQGATPLSSYQRDLRGARLLGAVIWAIGTAAFTIELSQNHDFFWALGISLLLTFPFGALIGASTSQACALAITRWGLRLKGESLPRLISSRDTSADQITDDGMPRKGFLEDARARQILRSVGTLYQFRHAVLQDYLLDQPIAAAANSSSASYSDRAMVHGGLVESSNAKR